MGVLLLLKESSFFKEFLGQVWDSFVPNSTYSVSEVRKEENPTITQEFLRGATRDRGEKEKRKKYTMAVYTRFYMVCHFP